MSDPYAWAQDTDPYAWAQDTTALRAELRAGFAARDARAFVKVDPLVAELEPSERFLEELERIVREASTPRYVPNPYVPVDLLVQISGDRRLFYNPRDRHGYASRVHRALHPTPGFTRHTLGAREAARDWRRYR